MPSRLCSGYAAIQRKARPCQIKGIIMAKADACTVRQAIASSRNLRTKNRKALTLPHIENMVLVTSGTMAQQTFNNQTAQYTGHGPVHPQTQPNSPRVHTTLPSHSTVNL